MRPGLAFVGLFVFLLVIYALLADTLGSVPTFLLQAGIVLMLIGLARWFRRSRSRGRWPLFSHEEDAASPGPSEAEEGDREVPKTG